MKNITGLVLVLIIMLVALPLRANVLFDPTRPPEVPDTSLSESIYSNFSNWTLESTLVAPDRRVAVINGKLVSEGESVDGVRVIRISTHDVLVQTLQGRITLKLLPDIVERNP